MKKKWFKELEEFEIHHKIFVFIAIICLTIILTRILVNFYNPNPVIANFEIHHFDYGLFLLLIMSLLFLFGKKKNSLYLILTGFAFGLILDEIWFIRMGINSGRDNLATYNTTFPSVVVLVIAIILVIFLINYFRGKK